MAGVKGKSGRKPISHDSAEIQKTLSEAGVDGAHLIKDYIRGKDKHGNKVSITMVKLTACLQSIAHAVGLPRQKVDYTHTGDQLTLKDLAQLAEQYDPEALQPASKALQEALHDPLHSASLPDTRTPKTSKN